MKVFPYFIARIGGGDFMQLKRLEASDSYQSAEQILLLKSDLTQLKESLNVSLYRKIADMDSAAIQNMLLTMKRDIYNTRIIEPDVVENLSLHLDEHILGQLMSYQSTLTKIHTIFQQGEVIFNKEVNAKRNTLYELSKQATLRNGVLLSSQSLLVNLDKYLSNNTAASNGKVIQTELGLLKYLTRMYAKTSPFSTFNMLAMGQLTSQIRTPQTPGMDINELLINEKDQVIEKDKADNSIEITSYVRLNNYLYAYLKEGIIQIPDIARHLKIRPNPTIRRQKEDSDKEDEQDMYYFLTNSNNIESFQRMVAHPVKEMILALVQKGNFTSHQLAQAVLDSQTIDATYQEIEAYIRQLCNYGFLEYNFTISGIDPDWDRKFSQELEELFSTNTHELVSEIITTLKYARELTSRYESETTTNRQELVLLIHHSFKNLYEMLQKAAGHNPTDSKNDKPKQELIQERQNQIADEGFKQISFVRFNLKPTQTVYEDCKLNSSLKINYSDLDPLLKKLNTLLHSLRRFEVQCDRKDKLTHYFLGRYNKDQKVDLLTFYEDYYRDVELPEIETGVNVPGSNTPSNQVIDVPSINARHWLNTAWEKELTKLVSQKTQQDAYLVNITAQDLETINTLVPAEKEHPSDIVSLCSFIQLYKDQDEVLKGVVNLTYSGYGRMYSRFLHIFDPAMITTIKAWNRQCWQDGYMVENTDASYFNANLRPSLMENEIRVPNGHSNVTEDKQIPVTDICVAFDSITNGLQLRDKSTQKPVYIFDMGFQSLRGRSQLYQLLERFTPAEYIYPSLLTHPINNNLYLQKEPGKEKMLILPRITFEGQLILQRKSWLFAKNAFPLRQGSETDWSYFYRIQEWRLKHGIPQEVFISITNHREMSILSEEEQQKLGKDDHKPQYISFQNPFLIKLLEKLLTKVPKILKVEEMLPASDQLNSLHQSKYVTEFVFQWYN